MNDNIYRTPESDLRQAADQKAEFYIVSMRKFLLLYLGTVGFYAVYWFYRHWAQYKLYHGSSIWPIPRAIFTIFFVHSLFGKIRHRVRQVDPDSRWSANTYATLYVVLTLISVLSDALVEGGPGEIWMALLSLGIVFFLALILYQAQIYANRACNDPWGRANHRITLANVFWLLLGAIFWFFTLFVFAMMLGWVSTGAA